MDKMSHIFSCQDFRYANCYAGRERYDLPIEVIPKRMEVISRADISLEVPAANGKIIYRKKQFRDA